MCDSSLLYEQTGFYDTQHLRGSLSLVNTANSSSSSPPFQVSSFLDPASNHLSVFGRATKNYIHMIGSKTKGFKISNNLSRGTGVQCDTQAPVLSNLSDKRRAIMINNRNKQVPLSRDGKDSLVSILTICLITGKTNEFTTELPVPDAMWVAFIATGAV